ncbi:sigma-54 dependent transcriptional regulator [Actimicrobium sp. CCC2.4]|uniref:sigma-54 interaction domain-containing protein n=1 Tax=Actimicrobium sp. CCC2.4 TaxID=3048606 RepID=UPI002AC9DD02|nr:sigma-54 dependent transcriptional regulator [Actimicrobium sp. CCC2.4]MEB0136958.1 sigma-54 dependent transcriptional regulator [Actimicrobium sp. CCC2.4]WPX32732.1 sigma-54 dependent transcriptional regulator [Actimicrobium sp. CCC2.4]
MSEYPVVNTMRHVGMVLHECHTAEQAGRTGCTVGVVLVADLMWLQRLSAFEPMLAHSGITWVGLIAHDLVGLPAVRNLVADYLFNFIALPAPIEHIILVLRHARGMAFVRTQPRNIWPESSIAGEKHSPMLGRTPPMQRLFHQIKRVARTDAPVMIDGQSGTGKELAAQSIHRQSTRRHAPFVAVNCGAIPPQLFQSELFGYEKGAFTGAIQRRIGRIEAAQGGTLFLDEIGDLPMEMQVNLLRFLQEKTIERIGGNQTLTIDVRIIAATHIDLADAVARGRFREDLYYRINVVCITTPRLADRLEDIEELARHYFTRFASRHNKSLRGFSKAALHTLLHHNWPGNVRELVNRVQRAVVMADGRFIQPEDLGFDPASPSTMLMSLEDARAEADRRMIERALSQARNQVSVAAQLLGVSRVTLYRLIDKYRLKPSFFEAQAQPDTQFLQLVSAISTPEPECPDTDGYIVN